MNTNPDITKLLEKTDKWIEKWEESSQSKQEQEDDDTLDSLVKAYREKNGVFLHEKAVSSLEISFWKTDGPEYKAVRQDGNVTEAEPRLRTGKILSNLLFGAAIVLLFISVFSYRSGSSSISLFGYTGLHVLTSSMEPELPRGSFLLIRNVDPASLSAGDDITYLVEKDVSVTHRIVEVLADYNESGQPAFRTMGIANESVDSDIVYADNVVGKVCFSVPYVGRVTSYFAENLWIIATVFGLLIILSYSVPVFFRKAEEEAVYGKSLVQHKGETQ